MPAKPKTVQQYLELIPGDRREALRKVRAAVNEGLPRGYEEGIQYGIIGWYVPHRLYPDGYHCDPKQPVPFAGLASQKNHMSLYLMGIYGDESLRTWFEEEWAKTGKKLDMGKGCVRFRKVEDLPLELITRAVARLPVKEFLASYEASIPASKRKKK